MPSRHMIAVAADRERDFMPRTGSRTGTRTRTGHLAAHPRIVRELAQPPGRRRPVRGEDLLDGKHVGIEGPDHADDRLVVLAARR